VVDTRNLFEGQAQAVQDFPILVRLDSSTFDFAQAQRHGNDIRFADMAGNPLSYEIESWPSPVRDCAEIWVRLPVLSFDNSCQAFTMYWGNPSARRRSSRHDVFNRDNGYLAVHHLHPCGVCPPGLRASVSSSSSHSSASSSGSMHVSHSRSFSFGFGDLDNLIPHETRTAHQWFFEHSSSDEHALRGHGDERRRCPPCPPRPCRPFTFSWWFRAATDSLGSACPHDSAAWRLVDSLLLRDQANYMAHTIDTNGVWRWYFNGNLIDQADLCDRETCHPHRCCAAWPGHRGVPGHWRLVRLPCVDEVRVSNVTRAAEWIRLCWETKRDGSHLAYVDSTAPDITVVRPHDGAWLADATPDLHIGYTDAGIGGVEHDLHIDLDGADVTDSFTVGGGGATYTPAQPLAEGAHALTAWGADCAGNADTASCAFTIDITPPVVAITAPSTGAWYRSE